MARKKNYRPLIALAALAVAALALATMTFTNVTYWLINATLPPAMNYPGTDTQIAGRADNSGYNNYVYVSYYYDSDTGYNITKISIVGFTGDPTNYTNVLRLCNKAYDGTLYAKLVAVRSLGGASPNNITEFRLYFVNQTVAPPNYVEFQGTRVVESATGSVAIPYGQCAIVGAYVVVNPSLANNLTLINGKTVTATYQVNVVFSTSSQG